MVFEHLGLNVADLDAAVAWYRENLGLTVARAVPGGPTFLADDTGRTCLELYQNATAAALDFANLHYFTLHLAFVVPDIDAASQRLSAAGAVVIDPKRKAGDDDLVMFRDPFGVCVQLVRRAKAFF